ncbi:MAG: hypothetical protein ACI89T_002521, partial [Cognaticolwellia sp.]
AVHLSRSLQPLIAYFLKEHALQLKVFSLVNSL